MRRNLRNLLIAVTALAMLAGCGQSTSGSESKAASEVKAAEGALSTDAEYSGSLDDFPTSYPEPTDEDLTIGWLNPNGASEALAALGEAIQISTEQRGGTLVTRDALDRPDEQVTQMQQLIDSDVDAIIVWPLDAGALNPMVNRATAAGIPVIAVEANSDLSAEDLGGYTSQIAFGSDYLGFITAREMARQVPGGKIVVTAFAVPVPFISAMTEAQAKWAGEFGLDVVETVQNQTGDVAGASEAVTGAIAQHPDLQGVLSYNDSSAIGGVLAGRQGGIDLIGVGINGGSDALEAIRSERQYATLQWPIAAWADQLTAAAYFSAQEPDQELPLTVFPTPMQLITADTIDEAKPYEEQVAEMRQR